MTEGAVRHDWNQTAELLAMLHNTRFGETEPKGRDDFHPLAAADAARRQAPEPSPDEVKANWSALQSLVVAGKFR